MNHLALESSPYLRQHAHNPVDWYPWGEEAFARARAEAKPIFLSVGYSTCHWCHVMAHESFESPAIAEVLNRDFVPVKVDREERPDVDRVYMLFVQATTGSGGWPMSVWLTPDLEPFYGGTYFPPVSRWGRPGFADILEEIARAWRADPLKVRQSAAELRRQLEAHVRGRGSAAGRFDPDEVDALLGRAVADFRQAFDRVNGGFGGAPKFPRPSELLFLLREFARLRSHETAGASVGRPVEGGAGALEMVVKTLRAMAAGGIRDHVGGGFHRYSVDARWHVPHFEKMLYDQAQLVLAYVEAFQATSDRAFAQTAGDVLDYAARDLQRPGGGFFSAEDADSLPAGEVDRQGAHPREGAFYVWSEEEIDRVVGPDSTIVKARFGVRPDGNVESDPHGEFRGMNVLYVARSLEEIAGEVRRPPSELGAILDRARSHLFEARTKRPRPGLDDKILVAWNGLMIAAFARAARVLGHGPAADSRAPAWTDAARSAAAFLHANVWDEAGRRLLRRYREGGVGIDGYAEDYACLILGLLELFQATGEPRWLEWAVALQQRQDELFWDESGGGWFSTSGDDPSVLIRMKEDYDGAEPSASSVSVWNLLTLARLTQQSEWAGRVERTLAAFSHHLRGTPRAVPMMLAALSTWAARKHEIVIVGPRGRADTSAMYAAASSRFLPAAVVVPVDPADAPALSRLLPLVGSMDMVGDKATAYVCREFTCERPTTNPDEVVPQTGNGRVQ